MLTAESRSFVTKSTICYELFDDELLTSLSHTMYTNGISCALHYMNPVFFPSIEYLISIFRILNGFGVRDQKKKDKRKSITINCLNLAHKKEEDRYNMPIYFGLEEDIDKVICVIGSL